MSDCPCGLPPQLKSAIEEWLTANKKTPYEVRYGAFPLGMVQGWIERAKTAEAKVAEAEIPTKNKGE